MSTQAISTVELEGRLRHLEHRDWRLWSTAIVIALLLVAALFAVADPQLRGTIAPALEAPLETSLRALFGLVLLFGVFALYQQLLIGRIRRQLMTQLLTSIDLKTRAETLQRLATTDSLTQLHNRRFAEEQLPREINRSQRARSASCILLLDLDGFKQINDGRGHAIGDQVLQHFANCVRASIRASDFAVRMGGDEFLVFLAECSAPQVEYVVNRLRSHLNRRPQLVCDFSSGATQLLPTDTMQSAVTRADERLYSAKRLRKGPIPATALVPPNRPFLQAAQ